MLFAPACKKSGSGAASDRGSGGGQAGTAKVTAAPPTEPVAALDKVAATPAAVDVIDLGVADRAGKDGDSQATLALAPDGHPLVAYTRALDVQVQEWQGGAWKAVGDATPCYQLHNTSLAVATDGAIMVAGTSAATGSNKLCAAVFDGTGWSTLGGELATPDANAHLVITANGPLLIATGKTVDAWLWDGTQWKAQPAQALGLEPNDPLGSAATVAAAPTPDGAVVAWLLNGPVGQLHVARLATKTGAWTELPTPRNNTANTGLSHLAVAASGSGAVFVSLGAAVERLDPGATAWANLGDGGSHDCSHCDQCVLAGGKDASVFKVYGGPRGTQVATTRHDGAQWQTWTKTAGDAQLGKQPIAAAVAGDGSVFELWSEGELMHEQVRVVQVKAKS